MSGSPERRVRRRILVAAIGWLLVAAGLGIVLLGKRLPAVVRFEAGPSDVVLGALLLVFGRQNR